MTEHHQVNYLKQIELYHELIRQAAAELDIGGHNVEKAAVYAQLATAQATLIQGNQVRYLAGELSTIAEVLETRSMHIKVEML